MIAFHLDRLPLVLAIAVAVGLLIYIALGDRA